MLVAKGFRYSAMGPLSRGYSNINWCQLALNVVSLSEPHTASAQFDIIVALQRTSPMILTNYYKLL